MFSYEEKVKLDSEKLTDKLIEFMPGFAKEYFDTIKDTKEPRTVTQYAYDLKLFFDWIRSSAGFKNINIDSCTPSDILDKLEYSDILEYLKTFNKVTKVSTDEDGNKTKTTVHSSDSFKARKASSLKSFYAFYSRLGKIDSNLATLIPVPKPKEKSKVILSQEQIHKIMSVVYDSNEHEIIAKRDYAIMSVLFGVGVRVSELVSIDVEGLKIFEYVKDGEESGSLTITRKGGDQQDVYFGETVKAALLDYLTVRDEFFYSTKDPSKKIKEPQSEAALFVSYGQRKRMSVRSVEKLIEFYKTKAGFSDSFKITPHTARRSYATALLSATNGDIYLTADALGHKSIETTKIYAKLADEKRRSVGAIADNIFKK